MDLFALSVGLDTQTWVWQQLENLCCWAHTLHSPWHCYAPSPYLQTNRESEQVHCGNAKARREFFISSALGLKPHPTQRNQMRAPNKAVWRFIYSQLFVSVTGYLAIPGWTGRMSSCNAFLMLSHIEIFPYLVKERSSRKQETWLRSPALLCTSLSWPPCLTDWFKGS